VVPPAPSVVPPAPAAGQPAPAVGQPAPAVVPPAPGPVDEATEQRFLKIEDEKLNGKPKDASSSTSSLSRHVWRGISAM
jgi:hypothetical protein